MSYKQSLCYGVAIGALFGATLLASGHAAAQSNSDLSTQVDQLRQQVQQLQQQIQVQQQNPPSVFNGQGSEVAQSPSAPPLPNGAVQLGGIRLQLGGFIEEASIFRTRNEVADVGSDYNTLIPFNNSALAHENEWRQSARQSRVAGLASGDVDDDTHLAAYIEADFLSAGSTSNSRESNSYSLRIRHAYSTLDEDGWGFHMLAGQEWSLLTTNTAGIIPRQEQIPLTIDAQYAVGFNWKRQAQVRFVENWGNLWAAISFEDPEASLPPSPFSAATVETNTLNAENAGNAGGLLNPDTNYSNNWMPDIIAKVAMDPGFGHYELKGLVRGFSDTVNGTTNRVIGYGGGAAATLPVVPKFIDLQLSGLVGQGIGTYGSGQLPDVAFGRSSQVVAVPEAQGLVGIIGHPWVGNDIYLYGGWEHADRAGSPSTALGYGSGALNDSGCQILNGTCQAQTNDLKQLILGTWQNIYKGNFGRFVVGLQGTYEERDAFTSANGGAPSQNQVMVFTSIRYYPF